MNYDFEVAAITALTDTSKRLFGILAELCKDNPNGVRLSKLVNSIGNMVMQASYNDRNHSTLKVSTRMVKQFLLNFEEMRLIYIDRKPLGMDSTLVMLVGTSHISGLIKF